MWDSITDAENKGGDLNENPVPFPHGFGIR